METKKNNFKNFLIFFIGQSLSQFGSSLTGFALVVWAYTKTGEVMTSSILAICSTIPYLIVSLIGGSIVDRKSKKQIMLMCDCIAALCTTIIFISLQLDILEIWMLYIINAISGLMNAFQNPASQVVITLLVEKNKFVKFAGLQSAFSSMLGIFSPIIASSLLSLGGLKVVLFIDILTFVFAFFSLLLWIKIPENIPSNNVRFADIMSDIKNGFLYLKNYIGIVYLLIIYSTLSFIGAISFDSMMVPLILARTNNTMAVGIVSGAMALSGTLAGIIISISKERKNKINIMFNGILIAFVGIMSFGLVNNVFLWCLIVLIGCFGMPFYFAYESAILRENIVIDMQGKIFAIKGMITQVLTPVGYFIAAFLADYIFEPFMNGNSKLKNFFECFVETGNGAGISLIFVLAGLIGIILTFILRNNKHIKALNK